MIDLREKKETEYARIRFGDEGPTELKAIELERLKDEWKHSGMKGEETERITMDLRNPERTNNYVRLKFEERTKNEVRICKLEMNVEMNERDDAKDETSQEAATVKRTMRNKKQRTWKHQKVRTRRKKAPKERK